MCVDHQIQSSRKRNCQDQEKWISKKHKGCTQRSCSRSEYLFSRCRAHFLFFPHAYSSEVHILHWVAEQSPPCSPQAAKGWCPAQAYRVAGRRVVCSIYERKKTRFSARAYFFFFTCWQEFCTNEFQGANWLWEAGKPGCSPPEPDWFSITLCHSLFLMAGTFKGAIKVLYYSALLDFLCRRKSIHLLRKLIHWTDWIPGSGGLWTMLTEGSSFSPKSLSATVSVINHSHSYSNAELHSSPVLLWAPEQRHGIWDTFILCLICGWTEHWGRCLHQGHGSKEFLPAPVFFLLRVHPPSPLLCWGQVWVDLGGSSGIICKEKSVTFLLGSMISVFCL